MWFNQKITDQQKQELSQMRPVVVMGRGHSGTRVLAWICQHLNIELGVRESLATGDAIDLEFTQQIKKIATRNIGIRTFDEIQEKDLQRFQSAVWSYQQKLAPASEWWGWKFPETYLITPYIAQTFPNAYYLHMVRDGRDIAFKQHLTDDPERKLGKALLSHKEAMSLPHHLQAAISWAFQVDEFDHFKQNSLSKDQVLDLRFEDLCQSPQQETERIAEFLGLPITPVCQNYIEQNINPRKVSQYQEQDSALVQEVQQQIASTLKRYSYL